MSQTGAAATAYLVMQKGVVPPSRRLGTTSNKETVSGMKIVNNVDRLIEKRWPKLKNRAQNERNTGKLIAILEEIEDLLCLMEMRIAAHDGRTASRPASVPAALPTRWDGSPGTSEFKRQ